MPMLWPDKTKQARMWVYVGDEHNPYNVFDFTLGRGRDGPATFLKGYKQTLLADAYGGYDGVVVGNDITRAGCWAHAKKEVRRCGEIASADRRRGGGMIKRLYAVEDRGKGLDIRTTPGLA